MAPVLKDMLVGQLTTGVSPAALEKNLSYLRVPPA